MKFLADECCDAGLVVSLRSAGHDVTYVTEQNAGSSDDEVLLTRISHEYELLRNKAFQPEDVVFYFKG
ncbi:hypothetical protein C6A36_01865, partial [Desulfobacteraceae bacterium SEEP-SAG10]